MPLARETQAHTRDLVVIGGSAGATEALRAIVAGLPADFPAALLVVIHTAPSAPRLLPQILSASGRLPAQFGEDGERVQPGRIYVAPPDRHLLIDDSVLHVVRGPKENRARPAIDPLFRSAAWSNGPRVVGILLSGMLNDGPAGLWAIKTCGGMVVAQDPATARYADMPRHAIDSMEVDYSLPPVAIADLLIKLVKEPLPPHFALPVPQGVKLESEMARMRENDFSDLDRLGKLSPYACPACSGLLWEVNDEHMLRYRCHTGHAFTAEHLAEGQHTNVEDALFSAVRALEENVRLSRAIAARSRDSERDRVAKMYERKASEAEASLQVLRGLLAGRKP